MSKFVFYVYSVNARVFWQVGVRHVLDLTISEMPNMINTDMINTT